MDRVFDALTVVADGGTPNIARPGAGVWEPAIKERGDAYRVVYALQLVISGWFMPSRRNRPRGLQRRATKSILCVSGLSG